jgi:hypothetical protein
MLRSSRARMLMSEVSDFITYNKKAVISFALVFVLAAIIGVWTTISYSGGEFERIPNADIVFSSVKVFFGATLAVAGGSVIILISGGAGFLAILSLAPFLGLGYFFGRYMCILAACYGSAGVINLVFIYLPFFLITFVCMVFAAVTVLDSRGCNACAPKGSLRPSFAATLKIFGINTAINFVIFILIGALAKVIVVDLGGIY